MDNMIIAHSHELRGRNIKPQKHTPRFPSNYIDADLPPGHREPLERREPRFVKKKRAENHEHFICIVQDDDGTWSVRSSDSLRAVKKRVLAAARPHIDDVFGRPEAQFDEVKDERVPQHQLERLQSTLTDSRTSTVSYPFTVKRRRAASESTAGGTQCETRLSTVAPASVTIPGQVKITTGRKKPRREMVMLKIRMDETERWYEWMQNAFKAIQQIACRSIAKEWIKAIHPKKQSTHPYNGNMPRTERKSPDRTRPPYWPRDVKHKEPDHIDKGQRTLLLTYILMNTPQPEIVPDKDKRTDKYFAAKDLLAVLEQKQDEFVVPRMEMIRDVINVRYHLELYEEGGVDADATLDVVDYSESFRNGNGGKKKKDSDSSTVKTEDEAEVESNDQEDEEKPCTTYVNNGSDDEKVELRASENTLDIDPEHSFTSECTAQDDSSQTDQSTQPQHADSYHSMTADHQGFLPDTGQVEPSHNMHLDQHDHMMQFQPHHNLSNSMTYMPEEWAIDAGSTLSLNNSFGDGMMLAPNPMTLMDHNAYEGQIVLRTRPINDMATAHSFHEDPHYSYIMDQDLPSDYHLIQMSRPIQSGMHHGFESDMYSAHSSFGGQFMS